MKEAWYKNTTTSDLNLSDLGLRLPAGSVKNLFKMKPTLTEAQVLKSEQEGGLFKCKQALKVIKLPFAPPAQNYHTYELIKESKVPIPSRSKSAVTMDLKEKDYIEDLEDSLRVNEASAKKYVDSMDGIGDPMALDSEEGMFKVVVVPPVLKSEPSGLPVASAPKIKASGSKTKFLTIDVEE